MKTALNTKNKQTAIHTMKKRTYFLFGMLMLFSMGMPRLHATHVAGMDLSLICLGGNDYIIRLTLYRDCGGIAAPATSSFAVQCTSNPMYNFSITGIQPLPGSGVEVTPICPTWQTKCTGGPLYGVQEFVYETQVTLPACNHWRVSWSGPSPNLNGLCCRNAATTVVNANSENAYIEVTFDNLNAPCPSTVQSMQIPVLSLCVGQSTCINMGGVDIHGDSLVYELVTPMTNGNQGTLTWIPPYSAQQPFPSVPPITLDPLTGVLCMTPTQSFTSPMAIRIQKWRTLNGIPTLIATSIRDIQVNAEVCNNTLPVLSGIDTTMTKGFDPNDTTYLLEVCFGDTVQFAIWGHDPDIPDPQWGDRDKFSISWNNGTPQGQFNAFHNHTDSAFATFSWIPGMQHISSTPRCFIASIRDGACPYNAEQSFTYCILVKGTEFDLGHDTLLCLGESIHLAAASATPANTYHWFVNGYYTGHPLHNDTFTFHTQNLQPGVYNIHVEGNRKQSHACPMLGGINIEVVKTPEPDLGPDRVVYGNNPVLLDAGPGQMYLWSTGSTTRNTLVYQTGLVTVIVDGGNGTRCLGYDSVYIEFIIGVDELLKDPELVVSPNPTTGNITFTLPPPADGGWSAQIHTSDGREVKRKVLPLPHEGDHYSLQLGQLSPGIYLLTFSSGNLHYRSKVVLSAR